MQYLFDIHCLIVCLKMDFVYRMKHVREGERRSRRKLGLSPELKTYPFEPSVPRFWYKLVVEVPVPVPVEATNPELPWDLQNIAVVTSVARPVVSSPTPAIHLGYGETMASIGQGVVGEVHCISLVVVAEEQMLEPIDIVPALQRGWAWWCAGAALNVGNTIVI